MRLVAAVAPLVFAAALLAADAQDSGKKVLGPTEAAKLAKEALVTVEMEVKSASASKTKEHWWLNSKADYKDAKNFSVFIPKSVVEDLKKMSITDPKAQYNGKTVRVTGYLQMHNSIPAITLHNAKNIKIVQK